MADAAPDPRFGLARSVTFAGDAPLRLDSGQLLSPLTIAYETYGLLNTDASNAVLVFHALTGDQYLANVQPLTGKPGWWDRMVGPGRIIDTNRLCVICANVLGGCLGTSGPASLHPDDGKPYGMRFPVITIRDMVRAQARLLDHLGIDVPLAVIGGSMGGMQVLEWAAEYPERMKAGAVIACAAKHSAQNIAFHEVGRQAIMADPRWNTGDYAGNPPASGLAVARMAAHITYLSEEGLTEKFGRKLQSRYAVSFGFEADFQVENYLRYQGSRFVERFDANSYLYITRAMDYHDVAGTRGIKLADVYKNLKARMCVVSFTSDWLYPTAESRQIVHAFNASGAPVSFVEIESTFGHDSFLLDVPGFDDVMRGFVQSVMRENGL
jgi:homoserine O-acetyltransferase/O-succinyltransferase